MRSVRASASRRISTPLSPGSGASRSSNSVWARSSSRLAALGRAAAFAAPLGPTAAHIASATASNAGGRQPLICPPLRASCADSTGNEVANMSSSSTPLPAAAASESALDYLRLDDELGEEARLVRDAVARLVDERVLPIIGECFET